jgi:hypothetical protein
VNPDELSGAEQGLWRAFPRGEHVDLSAADGAARTVRAEVVAALLLGALPAAAGRVAAVRLTGARVTGPLDLSHSAISGPVMLSRCEFDSAIDMSGAQTRDVQLDGSRLTGLTAALAEVNGNLSIIGAQCSGQVKLTGAHLTGALQMQDSVLDHPGHVALLANRLIIDDDLLAHRATVNGEMRLAGAQVGGIIGLGGAVIRSYGRNRAVNGYNMSVGLGLLANSGFTAEGEVVLSGTTVGQNLSFREAVLSNPGGDALIAHGVQVGGYLSLEKCSAHGAVRLSRARVSAEIFLSKGRFVNPGADAIRCRNAEARTLVLGPDLVADGTVDLRFSRFAIIQDDDLSWPRRMRLSGLEYDALEPQLPAAKRVTWLLRDVDGYLPQNYETLAGMYRRHADDSGARTVLLAKERQHREQLPWYGRAWSWLQEITVGYGYRPLRAGGWLVAFLAVGTLVFGLHHPPVLSGTAHPAFNPLIYSLDLMVPLVGFGLRAGYDPQGAERWLAYLLVAVGWIFVTTIAAGIARVLRRQ